MILKNLEIENFRNFKKVNVDLTNRNIIFGLNDIGKSNFLSAIRFLLDRNFRRNGLIDSDFYNKDISKEIIITIKIDISNEEDEDNKKIYAMMKGVLTSDSEHIYIQLKSTYNTNNLIGEPNLFWGTSLDDLEEVPSSQLFFELDKHFNVIYIDSSIQLENIFKKYSRDILRRESSVNDTERKKLTRHINNLNSSIGNLSTIKKFENDLLKEYKKFKEDKRIKISIQSEIELNNLHSKLTPYLQNESLKNYPTSGDGRKKILAYTLLTLEHRKSEERKINIFLVEELENHLHRSMQIALSYQIFSDKIFKHLFMTTHSSLIVSQMDDVNLIKLFKSDLVVGESYVYKVPDKYKNLKQKLNQNLAEAIYADVVLLIEGPSEKILFERVLKRKCERYESYGGYILEVDGINFQEYYNVLINLGIDVIVKTDNDLKKVKKTECNLLGINRCLNLLGDSPVSNLTGIDSKEFELNAKYRIDKKNEVFSQFSKIIEDFETKGIFLSKVDLENDLYDAVPEAMNKLAQKNNSKKNGIDYLQSSKLINMIELTIHLKNKDIDKIYENERFKCLKTLVEKCAQ